MSSLPVACPAVEHWRYPFAVDDPFLLPSEFEVLRREQPIARVRMASSGDPVYLVTRYEDVRAVLSDQRFSRNLARPDTARMIDGVRQPSSPFADPPVHTRWRRLVSRAFTARRVEAMRPRVAQIVDGLLDAIEQAGPPADMMEQLAFPLPIAVVCTVLGIEPDRHRQVRDFARIALSTDADTSGEYRISSYEGMVGHVTDLIQAKREEQDDDLLSWLIAVHDDDGDALSDQELLATTMTLLIGGYENTAHQIGKSIQTLLAHPQHLGALREEPVGMAGRMVEETLRYSGAIDSGYGSPRYATEDVEVGGVVIPRGATVLVIRASANRDPDQFADPDRFDPSRDPSQHLTFGIGPHFCLGAPLARLEMETAFVALARRFPTLRLGVPADDVVWAFRLTAAGPAALPVTW